MITELIAFETVRCSSKTFLVGLGVVRNNARPRFSCFHSLSQSIRSCFLNCALDADRNCWHPLGGGAVISESSPYSIFSYFPASPSCEPRVALLLVATL